MGGGPAKEVLLCVLPLPEPTATLEHLRKTFPNLEIHYINTRLATESDEKTTSNSDSSTTTTKPGVVPPELWQSATVLCSLFSFPKHVSDAPKLELVHLISAGSNQLEHEPLYTDADTTITTSSGIHGPQIAEWVLLTGLVASHKYHTLHALQRAHRWVHSPGMEHDFRNIEDRVGRRLGVLGYGSIGRQVGRVAKAMGMRVVAYTATPKDSPEKRKDSGFIVPGTGDPDGEVPVEWYSGLEKAALREFLSKDLDWLVVAVPLTKETTRFLGREEFAALSQGGKRKPFVANIARGKIIDQPALIEALKDGTLGGAALDVTDPEPLPADSELWDLENVIITPHVAGVGSNYTERTFQVLEENLKRKAKGEKLLNVVRRERGY